MVNTYLDCGGQAQGGKRHLPKLSIPSPGTGGRDSQSSPLFQGSACQDSSGCESEAPPFFLGGLFSPQQGSPGFLVGLPWGSCPPDPNPDLNSKVQVIFKSLGGLKSRAIRLDAGLGLSYKALCTELDEVWSEVEKVKGSPASRAFGEDSLPSFQGRQSTPTPSSPMGLSPAAFQQLMRQVMDNLTTMGFENSQEGVCGLIISLSNCVNTLQGTLSGISSQLSICKGKKHNPGGAIGRVDFGIRALEDHRGGNTIKQGGKTYQDLMAVTAWVNTFRTRIYSAIAWTWSPLSCCVRSHTTQLLRAWPLQLQPTRLSIIVLWKPTSCSHMV